MHQQTLAYVCKDLAADSIEHLKLFLHYAICPPETYEMHL